MKTKILISVLVCLSAAACQRTVVRQPLAIDELDPADTSKQMEFWHNLPGRSAVSNNEGLHGLLLFVDNKDEAKNYPERVAAAKAKGWLPDDFDEPGDLVMQRGTLARAVAKASDIKGGVMMRITNGSARYAERELEYLRIMGPGTQQQAVSGLDYVGVISKMQDYLAIEEVRAASKKPTSRIRPVAPREENYGGAAAPAPGSGAKPADGAAPPSGAQPETPKSDAPAEQPRTAEPGAANPAATPAPAPAPAPSEPPKQQN